MKPEQIDHIDTTILSELAVNARASQVDLAERVGLSSTAIARRQKVLEEEGFIRGYQAVLDLARFGLSTTEPLERICGRPVLTSNQSMVWHLLRSSNILDSVEGFGELFKGSGSEAVSA